MIPKPFQIGYEVDIYGAAFRSAFPGMQPFHMSVQKPLSEGVNITFRLVDLWKQLCFLGMRAL